MEVLVFILLFWVLPVWVGHQIGKGKNRAGWAWGLLLGWIGVVIVAVLPRSDPPTGLTRQKDLITFRPQVVTGAVHAGYTYGFRTTDQILLRQAIGSDQWVEVTEIQERAQVLALMADHTQGQKGDLQITTGASAVPPAQSPKYRQCPHCKKSMQRDASVCPQCRNGSEPWTLNDGFWWAKDPTGSWRYFDEETKTWRAEGDVPGATSSTMTPGRPVVHCPDCAEELEATAASCRFCGAVLQSTA